MAGSDGGAVVEAVGSALTLWRALYLMWLLTLNLALALLAR
jgi:hypothetical protein